MAKKLTYCEFIKKLELVNNNIMVLSDKYVNNTTKVLCKCNICHHEWMVTPMSLLSGKQCPECSKKNKSKKRKMSHEQFIEKFNAESEYVNNIKIKGKYVDAKTPILCECIIDNYEWSSKPNRIINNGCPKCSAKKRGESQRLTHKDFIEKLKNKNNHFNNNEFEILGKYVNYDTPLLCRCKKDYYEWETSPRNLLKGYGCPCCSNQVCVKGINDIATTHPHLIKYFLNIDDSTKYTYGTNEKVYIKCPDCGYIKYMTISSLASYKFSCPICSVYISYPNRFLRNLFHQLKINNVEYEYSPDWTNRRYDAYFVYNNRQYIVEMDGRQHYIDNSGFPITLKEQQEIDLFKTRMALEHNIEIIRINCSESSKNFIRNSIINSKISSIVDLSIVDWDECDRLSRTNLFLDVCTYYNNHINLSFNEIGNVFELSKITIYRIIKEGASLGLCNYSYEQSKKYIAERMRKTRIINGSSKIIYVYKDDTLMHSYESSIKCANEMTNIYKKKFYSSSINLCCKGKQKTHNGFEFKHIVQQGDGKS